MGRMAARTPLDDINKHEQTGSTHRTRKPTPALVRTYSALGAANALA